MSLKQWFILKTDHHIGPLGQEQVIDLFKQRRLKETDLLWTEGAADWKELREIEDFSALFAPPPTEDEDLPPPLPPLPPIEESSVESSVEPSAEPVVPVVDLPELPDLPEVPVVTLEIEDEVPSFTPEPEVDQPEDTWDELTNPDLVLPDREDEDEGDDDQEDDDQDEFWEDQIDQPDQDIPQSPASKLKWVAAAFVCLLVLALSFSLLKPKVSDPVFHELRVQDATRLEAFLRENKNNLDQEQMPFAFSLSRDGRGLMVVSPYPEEAKLYLELNSVKGRVLSLEELSMKAEAVMQNRQAWFKELQLNSGMSLAPGLYRYTLTAVPVGPVARLRKFLQQNGLAKGAIKRFTSSGEVLLLREDEEEFQKKLAQYREKIAQGQLRPLQDRVQQYQTLEQMAQQILGIYREVLPTVKEAKDLKVFETRYAQSVGRLLQTLIIEAHQKSEQLKNTNVEESYTYEHLRDFGREVGELVSDMVTTTEQTKNLDVTKKNRLLRQFENRVKNLQRESQRRREVIEKELQTFE